MKSYKKLIVTLLNILVITSVISGPTFAYINQEKLTKMLSGAVHLGCSAYLFKAAYDNHNKQKALAFDINQKLPTDWNTRSLLINEYNSKRAFFAVGGVICGAFGVGIIAKTLVSK